MTVHSAAREILIDTLHRKRNEAIATHEWLMQNHDAIRAAATVAVPGHVIISAALNYFLKLHDIAELERAILAGDGDV